MMLTTVSKHKWILCNKNFLITFLSFQNRLLATLGEQNVNDTVKELHHAITLRIGLRWSKIPFEKILKCMLSRLREIIFALRYYKRMIKQRTFLKKNQHQRLRLDLYIIFTRFKRLEWEMLITDGLFNCKVLA